MTTITEANKALVRRYLQAVIDGDVDTVEGVQHPDCKWWVVGQGDIDRETFNAMTRSGLLAAEKRSLEIISMTAEGDRVAYEAKGEMVFPDRVYRSEEHTSELQSLMRISYAVFFLKKKNTQHRLELNRNVDINKLDYIGRLRSHSGQTKLTPSML